MASQLFLLLQVEPRRISWLIWVGAGVVLVVGVSLVVYFVIRLRKGEKDPEEDWDISKGSLFVEAATAARAPSPEPPPNVPPHVSAPVEPRVVSPPTTPPPAAAPPVIPPLATGTQEQAPIRPTEEAIVEEAGQAEETNEAEEATQAGELSTEVEQDQSLLDHDIWAQLEEEPGSRRDTFEPPVVEPIAPRRPAFEPPTIEPIVPRPERGTAVAGTGEASVSRRPAEARLVTSAPGEPALKQSSPGGDDVVHTLSTYGRYIDDDDRGYLGTIILLIAVLVVVAGVLAYFYVPSVRNWFSTLRERARPQTEQAAVPERPTPKAQILPLRPESVNNQVKIRGAVYNLSNEPLAALVMEVKLLRSDGSSDAINVPIKPESLAPREQGYLSRGTFEFEYDGKQHNKYEISKLLSNGAEVPIKSN